MAFTGRFPDAGTVLAVSAVVTSAQQPAVRGSLPEGGTGSAALVVLSDGGRGSSWTVHRDLLLKTATDLFGPPTRVDDVWLWRVA